ncbi:MAG: LamG-like jellyroll fold domain-containing protein [Pirellulales bacterium]
MLRSRNVSANVYPGRATGRRGGFTLVELLVVIGIIIILMSVLLPVVNAVRESSRSTECQSNQQQIHNVFLVKQDLLGTRLRPENLPSYFKDELGDTPEVYQCPNAVTNEATAAADSQWSTLLQPQHLPPNSFGFNPRLSTLNGKRDAQKIFSLDYKTISVDVLGPQAAVEQFVRLVAPRHRGECNVLFFDGHIESRDPMLPPNDNLSIDPNYCWVHEDHWRPFKDIHLKRTEGDCTPRRGDTAAAPELPEGEVPPGEEEPPGECEMPAPVVMDDKAAILRGADWTRGGGGHSGGHQVSPAGGESVNAQWTVPQLDHSIYQVMVTWEALPSNTQQATFQVYDGGTTDNLLEEFQVDMREKPETELYIGGAWFKELSRDLEIRNGAITILLISNSGGNICADGVRVSCPGDETDGQTEGTDGRPPPPPPGPDLLLNYRFDDGQHPGLDSSEEGNHGWLVSATHLQCQSGGAVALSGDNGFGTGYIEAPSFEMGGAITISAWVNYNSFEQEGKVFRFGVGSNEIVCGNYNSLGTAYFRVGGATVSYPNCFEIGTWVHITCSVSDTGELKITKTGGGGGGTETGNGSPAQWITRDQHHIGENIDGLIDDVRVYNIVSQPDPGEPPSDCSIDLTIHYDFDNRSNPYKNVADSGVGYDADPQGNPWASCSSGNSGYLDLGGGGYLNIGQTGVVGDQSITVMAWIKVVGPAIFDDTDQEFSTNGSNWTTNNSGYQDGQALLPAGNYNYNNGSGHYAEFVMQVEPGNYKIYANWPSDATEAAATFSVADGDGIGAVAVPVNQSNASNNATNAPFVPPEFQFIRAQSVDTGTLRVRIYRQLLFFQRPGIMSADAILIMPEVPAGSQPGGPIFGTGSGTRAFAVGTSGGEAYIQIGGETIHGPADLFGKWVHLCGVYDAESGQATVYVDGQQVASGPAQGNFSDASFPTVAKAGGLNFVGKMDEFWFYSRALKAGEISGRSGQQPSCQD